MSRRAYSDSTKGALLQIWQSSPYLPFGKEDILMPHRNRIGSLVKASFIKRHQNLYTLTSEGRQHIKLQGWMK
ncbi:MAG: hypothetical protein M0Q91_10125 [Methanoregula sp.]|jgi:hypothetical protein|nr:hypothetical protein [Methanoregula sp.]